MKKRLLVGVISIFLLAGITYNNVSQELSEEDIIFISRYLSSIPSAKPSKHNNYSDSLSFEEQIKLIKQIQATILAITPPGKGIPPNQERNPKDLFLAGEGLCHDYSFVLEKTFKGLGFQTRHVSLFEDLEGKNFLEELLTKDIESHAVSEVLTKKGWLIVDSNNEWIGITKDGNPISMELLSKVHFQADWFSPVPANDAPNFNKKCGFVYGLYARHGRYYPPFNPIPDYRVQELIYNFNRYR